MTAVTALAKGNKETGSWPILEPTVVGPRKPSIGLRQGVGSMVGLQLQDLFKAFRYPTLENNIPLVCMYLCMFVPFWVLFVVCHVFVPPS